MSDPISRLLAHYEIDEKSLEVTPKQLKQIKADMKRYKAAITDTTIRDYKRMNMAQETMTKTVSETKNKIITKVEYVPKSSTGPIKLGMGNKLHRTVIKESKGIITQRTATQLKTTHHSRGMAGNIVGHYETLLKILKK